MTKIAEILESLVDKITSIQIDGNDIFAEVYGFAQGDFTGFPAVVITHTGGTGEVIDTHRNERIHNFELRLYQEQSRQAKNKAEADAILVRSVDAILEAFDTDKDLGGDVKRVEVVEFTTDFADRPGTFNYATFRINCHVIVDNY